MLKKLNKFLKNCEKAKKKTKTTLYYAPVSFVLLWIIVLKEKENCSTEKNGAKCMKRGEMFVYSIL